MTERAQNADFRRKPQIFADSPLLLEIQAFGGRRKPQKTTDFRRKPQIFAENRRKPQIGLRHLRCVTFSSALIFCQKKRASGCSLLAQKSVYPQKYDVNLSGHVRPPQTFSEPIFLEGDATKHFSVKKGLFSEKGEGNPVNQGFGKDFYRKGNSVKRSGLVNRRTLQTERLLFSSPPQKSALTFFRSEKLQNESFPNFSNFWPGFSGAAKRGGFQTGGVSRSGLVLPFLSFFVLFDFPDLSGIFRICSGMVRGFSRFVPYLFLVRGTVLKGPRHNLDLS